MLKRPGRCQVGWDTGRVTHTQGTMQRDLSVISVTMGMSVKLPIFTGSPERGEDAAT